MQVTVPARRFDPRHIKQAALTIAILTSTVVGVTTATIVRDTADSSNTTIVTDSSMSPDEAFGYQYLEQNLDLPTTGAAPSINRHAGYVFMEQNLDLPGSETAARVVSSQELLFLEQNLSLPGATDVLTASTGRWQGEGLVGGSGAETEVDAFVPASMEPLRFVSIGMGEGWVSTGRPDVTLSAYPSDGQGEGWISTGRP